MDLDGGGVKNGWDPKRGIREEGKEKKSVEERNEKVRDVRIRS